MNNYSFSVFSTVKYRNDHMYTISCWISNPQVLNSSIINDILLKNAEVFHMHTWKLHFGSISMFVIQEISLI